MKQPLDHLRSRKKPTSTRVEICLDSQVADRYEQAKQTVGGLTSKIKLLQQARQRDQGEIDDLFEQLKEAEAELADAKAAVCESTAWFHVRALGPKRYEDLITEHVPTKEQKNDARKNGLGVVQWNMDTFPQALIVACVSYIVEDPEDGDPVLEPLTPEFVKEMQEGDDWNAGEYLELFQAAQQINGAVRRVGDLGNG